MRIASVLAVCGVLIAALPATAGVRQCERMSRDVTRYETMADRASAMDKPLWEERMRKHAEVLESRQEERCSDADMVLSTVECQDMTRRIERYETLAARAAERGNTALEEEVRRYIEPLKEERSERCPEWSPAAVANRAFMRMLKTAGELALTYFTMGYF